MTGEVLVSGLSVSPGVVYGRVRVLDTPHSGTVSAGEILVVPNSHPSYAVGLCNAAGLVCEVGGTLSHICIVALEMGVPCITQAAGAVELLRGVEEACLDADRGVVRAVR